MKNPEKNSIPKVSILIPTFNRCKLLDECLKKLSSNGYFNQECEINVSDNASTDDTKQTANKYPVNYQCNEKNIEYAGNIEVLLKSAKGQYIVILGDDDEFLFDWTYMRKLIDSECDLYVFGIEYGFLGVDYDLNNNINKLPFGFIGDCIQKNSVTFTNRFVNFKGRSNSPHFFARIDVFSLPDSKISYIPNELIRRFELIGEVKLLTLFSLLRGIRSFFIRPLDYGYYWYEARKELKFNYSPHISDYWVQLIDQSSLYTRQQHIRNSGLSKMLYYWFFQLYLRLFIYPGFSVYIIHTIIKSIFASRFKNK